MRRLTLADHVIVWEFDRDSVSSRLVCRAPKGAECRLVGPEHCQCESWVIVRQSDGQPYHRVETYGGPDIIHWMHDGGECHAGLFMEAGGAEEYADLPYERFTIGEVPVTFAWSDDGVLWRREEDDRG